MPEDNPCKQINEVMPSQDNQHAELKEQCKYRQICHFIIVALSKLAEVYHTKPDLGAEKEVIFHAVCYSERVKPWEFPLILIRIDHPKQILLNIYLLTNLFWNLLL